MACYLCLPIVRLSLYPFGLHWRYHVHIKKFFADYCMGVTPGLITARIAMNAGTPESMIAAIDMVRAEDGKVHIDVKGRWLAAQCRKTR